MNKLLPILALLFFSCNQKSNLTCIERSNFYECYTNLNEFECLNKKNKTYDAVLLSYSISCEDFCNQVTGNRDCYIDGVYWSKQKKSQINE